MSFWTDKRVCVTGGAGFLGGFVVAELERGGAGHVFVPRHTDYDLTTRADVVRRIIDERLTVRNRTQAQGRADSDPVVSNDNAENRASNRRVEVTLLLSPQERDRELNTAISGKQ